MRGIAWALLGLCAKLGWGLGAVEQTRLHLTEENPEGPSELFVASLNQGRKTLVFGNGERYPGLVNFLKERNHDITFYNNNTRLSRNGYYNYDSVVILGSGTIDRRIMNGITTFYDLRWTLPKSYDERYRSDVGNLVLPPSLLIIGCHDMKEFGLEKCSQRPTTDWPMASTDLNPFGFRSSGSVRTQFVEGRENKYLRRVLGDGSGFAIQGDYSWSRLGYLTDEQMCSGESEEVDPGCLNLMDWTFHRRNVRTWSDLKHFKVKKGQEFHEFTGLPVPNPYLDGSTNDGTVGDSSAHDHDGSRVLITYDEDAQPSRTNETDVHLENRRVYTIRDELVIGLDYYQLDETKRNVFVWKPADPADEVYSEYHMMVPYVRQTLDVYGASGSLHTKLMTKLSKTGGLNGIMTARLSRFIHFKAPVQHGVFKLIIKQSDQGLNSPIWIETLMPLRTYKHNEEQPKHIIAAYPYYLSIGIMILGSAVLLILLPLTKSPKPKAD